MKINWLKNGAAGLIVGVVVYVILSSTFSNGVPLMRYSGDIYGPTPIIVVLIWPILISPNVLGIVVAGLYYFVFGMIIGWVYRRARRSVGMVSQWN